MVLTRVKFRPRHLLSFQVCLSCFEISEGSSIIGTIIILKGYFIQWLSQHVYRCGIFGRDHKATVGLSPEIATVDPPHMIARKYNPFVLLFIDVEWVLATRVLSLIDCEPGRRRLKFVRLAAHFLAAGGWVTCCVQLTSVFDGGVQQAGVVDASGRRQPITYRHRHDRLCMTDDPDHFVTRLHIATVKPTCLGCTLILHRCIVALPLIRFLDRRRRINRIRRLRQRAIHQPEAICPFFAPSSLNLMVLLMRLMSFKFHRSKLLLH